MSVRKLLGSFTHFKHLGSQGYGKFNNGRKKVTAKGAGHVNGKRGKKLARSLKEDCVNRAKAKNRWRKADFPSVKVSYSPKAGE